MPSGYPCPYRYLIYLITHETQLKKIAEKASHELPEGEDVVREVPLGDE